MPRSAAEGFQQAVYLPSGKTSLVVSRFEVESISKRTACSPAHHLRPALGTVATEIARRLRRGFRPKSLGGLPRLTPKVLPLPARDCLPTSHQEKEDPEKEETVWGRPR